MRKVHSMMHAGKKRAAQKTHLVQYRLYRVDHLNNSITAKAFVALN